MASSKGIYEGLGDLLNAQISNDIKMRVFNDILQKHLDKVASARKLKHKAVKQENIPKKLVDLEETEAENLDSLYEKPKDESKSTEDALEKKILSLIETDKRGRVYSDNRVIANSNIKKIVQHIASGASTRGPAGTQHVLTLLKYNPILSPVIRRRKIHQKKLQENQAGSGRKTINIRWESMTRS